MNATRLFRTLHNWASIILALPILLIIVSGLLLQMKKDVDWVQPPTQKGEARNQARLSLDEILAAARAAPEAGIRGWDDVDRIDVQLRRGIAKVQGRDAWEVQVDTATGKVLQVAYRRSDIIEQIHDGSYFGDWAKYWVVLPTGVVLFGLWLTGVWLFVAPRVRRARARRVERLEAQAAATAAAAAAAE